MAETERTVMMDRMGRCARIAWEHGVEEYGAGAIRGTGVTTGHLLLGVLEEGECAGGLVLARLGLDLPLAARITRFTLLHGRRRDGVEQPTVAWEEVPHTPAAWTVMNVALAEANLFSATYPIGTEHLLLGLLRVPDGTGCRILRYFGIDENGVRAARDELWELLRLSE